MTRLRISRGVRTAPPRQLTLAEQIEQQIDRLYAVLPVARDERRRHDQTERVIDEVTEAGRALIKAARG